MRAGLGGCRKVCARWGSAYIELEGLVEDGVGASALDGLSAECLVADREDGVGVLLAKPLFVFQTLQNT